MVKRYAVITAHL